MRSRVFRERAEWILAAVLLASLALVTPRIAESDAIEYFSYLPSLLLDGDLDFENEYRHFYEEDPEGRQGFKETFLDRKTATGRQINFGPIGSALLWSPFYLATHAGLKVAARLGLEVEANGLSRPYRWAVALASALYAAVGLFLCYRLARRFAGVEASLAAVVALWWATPVAYYMYIAPGMSHAPSLFAVALFVTLLPWAAEGGTGRWALWGAAAGLMALVREQDLFIAVMALLVALSPRLGLDLRGRLVRLAAFGAAALLVFAPQLVVYQILNGRPLPSPHVENKMSWISPHFFEVLFSPQHGLFFWSPILLLFAAGIFFLARRQMEMAAITAAGLLSQAYISGATESWTQAGAFGSRRFLGTTILFALWGALVLEWLWPRLRRAGVVALVGFFLAWNVSLMMQFGLGLMDRQKLVWRQIVHNHVYEVPPRLFSVLRRYLRAREELAGSIEKAP